MAGVRKLFLTRALESFDPNASRPRFRPNVSLSL